MGVIEENLVVVLTVIVLVDILFRSLAPRFAFDMDKIDPALARIKHEELGPVYGD